MSSPGFEQDTSTVLRESVVPLPRRAPTVVLDPTPVAAHPSVAVSPAVQPSPPPKADTAFVGVLAALASLLAARLLLLLSVTFGFVLAIMAVRSDSYLGLAIVGTFASLTVLPLTWLDVVTHRRGAQ